MKNTSDMVFLYMTAVIFNMVTISILLILEIDSSDTGEVCGTNVCGHGSLCSNASCRCQEGFVSIQTFPRSASYCSEKCSPDCPPGMICNTGLCGCAEFFARNVHGSCKGIFPSTTVAATPAPTENNTGEVCGTNVCGHGSLCSNTSCRCQEGFVSIQTFSRNESYCSGIFPSTTVAATPAPTENRTMVTRATAQMTSPDKERISTNKGVMNSVNVNTGVTDITRVTFLRTTRKEIISSIKVTRNTAVTDMSINHTKEIVLTEDDGIHATKVIVTDTKVTPYLRGNTTVTLTPNKANDDKNIKYAYIGVGFALLGVMVAVVVVILRRRRRITKRGDSPTDQNVGVVTSAEDLTSGVFPRNNIAYNGDNSLDVASTAGTGKDEQTNNYEVITVDYGVSMISEKEETNTTNTTENISQINQIDLPITPDARPMHTSNRHHISVDITANPKQGLSSLDGYQYVEIPLLEVPAMKLENQDGYLKSIKAYNKGKHCNLNEYDVLNSTSKQSYGREISPTYYEIYDQPNGFKNSGQTLEKRNGPAGQRHLTDHTNYDSVYNYVDQKLFEKDTQEILYDSNTYDRLKDHSVGK